MYLSIPWRPLVTVHVCLGGHAPEKDRPNTAYVMPDDKPLMRLHEEMEYVLTYERPLDESDRASMRESWDAAETMWLSRTRNGDPKKTAARVRELFDNLPKDCELSRCALEVHTLIIKEFAWAVCGVGDNDGERT